MARDLGIADRLRAEGLKVREVAGWKTRGDSTFEPKGSVNHHTAGPAPAPGRMTPSLGIVVNGRPDLSGPLCNVYLGFDDVAYVVAAGRANHAGIPDGGVCRGMHGNTDAYGLEVEWPGTSRAPQKTIELAARIHAGLLRGKGIKASQVVQHSEWAPSRKVDFATNFPTRGAKDDFRKLVAKQLARIIAWEVFFKAGDGSDDKATTNDVVKWTANHPGPFRRGVVRFKPKK